MDNQLYTASLKGTAYYALSPPLPLTSLHSNQIPQTINTYVYAPYGINYTTLTDFYGLLATISNENNPIDRKTKRFPLIPTF